MGVGKAAKSGAIYGGHDEISNSRTLLDGGDGSRSTGLNNSIMKTMLSGRDEQGRFGASRFMPPL